MLQVTLNATSVLLQVTNEMISTCKAYITLGVSRVWDHSDDELKQRIADCIQLNSSYQKHFHKLKDKLRQTPSEKQFDFR